MTCAQGLLRLLWGGGARSWSATGLTTMNEELNPELDERAVLRLYDSRLIYT